MQNHTKDNVNYNAFTEETADLPEDLSESDGLKLKNNKSMFSNDKDRRPSSSDFEKSVSNYKHNDLDLKNKVGELSIKFKSFITDKTLKEQRSSIKKDLESSTVRELSEIALRLNGDQNQPEGIGSVGIGALLMQIILLQRDQINDLSYQIMELKKSVQINEKKKDE